MTNFSKIALCAMVIGAGVFTSCKKDDAPAADNSIYGRLGGTTLVADPDNAGQTIEKGRLSYRKVVNRAIGLIVADATATPVVAGNLAEHFAPILAETGTTQSTNIAKLSDNLVDFFSSNTGGTNAVNAYTGLDMATAHAPGTGAGKNPRMGVVSTNADFDKFEGYVGASAQAEGVLPTGSTAQLYTDIVAVLESLRTTIVQPAPSIYSRLGGTTLVADPDNAGQMIEKGRLSYRKVVNSAIGLIVADIAPTPQPGNLSAHFAPLLSESGTTQSTNIAILSDNLTDFFSFNTGGTNAVNTYTGLDMTAAHKPGTGAGKNPRMGAVSTSANFTKFEGYVGAAANMNGVAANTRLYADIVAVLESLRAQIVQG